MAYPRIWTGAEINWFDFLLKNAGVSFTCGSRVADMTFGREMATKSSLVTTVHRAWCNSIANRVPSLLGA